ncbi:hypothetical protein N9A87_01480 [Euryarchaeota archaeon]|nr:hypothetical protein [Euryarchaeota archaeon]
MNSGPRLRASMLCLMLLLPLVASAQADGQPVAPSITTSWTDDGNGGVNHAYTLTFSDEDAYEINVELNHVRNEVPLENEGFIAWSINDDRRTAEVTFNTSIQWADELELIVDVIGWNGETLAQPVTASRSLTVGTWNQPMADHEVMTATTWNLNQTFEDENGTQSFVLSFVGQGWQERVGLALNSWELGNGSLLSTEVTNESQTTLDLALASIWKNETIMSGILTSQVFDARGSGTLLITSVDDGTTTMILANVSDGRFNRTMIDGNISERVNLQASGALEINSDDEDGLLTIDGEISVLYLETWDENGVRRLDHTQFEALANMVLEDDGTRIDIDLDGLTTLERWVDGVRIDHKEELVGSGTFGFGESDENSSIQINGTILDFHTLIEDGITLTDDMHVDGVITGDAQGSFGMVRTIEETGEQANATGQVFLVNVIHDESWFNLTGINGGNFFEGEGIGASHNETWDYQVIQSDWENRTVRLVWEESGADSSSGDEKPARSPIETNATQPEAQEILGNISIVRETGLMPIPMLAHDVVHLTGEDGLELTVEAFATGVDPRDGFNLSVVHWTGVYGDSGGIANGSIVDEGPLMGLVSSVVRSLEFPYGEGNDTALFSESQVVERILSPSIITAENNSAPILVELGFVEGLIIGEGGSTGTLVAHVTDAEFNIQSVLVDLTPLGGEVVMLNDRGLNGDAVIGDDRYTALHIVKGLEVGNVTLNVTATDWFGTVTEGQGTVEVVNQGPRLTSVDMLPDRGPRGTTVIINAQAYDGHGVDSVQIDMRDQGGLLVNLTATNGIWAGNFSVPETIAPGEHNLNFILTDALGRKNTATAWHGTTANATLVGLYGPHYLPDDAMRPVTILVFNTPPSMVAPSSIAIEKGNAATTELLEVEIYDTDGIAVAQANLGVFTPLGTRTVWVAMNDEGRNGDRIAGDGVYTVEMSVRGSIPLGTHEVLVQSSDSYGEATGYTSIAVTLAEADSPILNPNGEFLTTGVLLGILALFGVGVAAIVILSIRNGPKRGEGEDMFGLQ